MAVGLGLAVAPLVFAVEPLHHALGHDALEVADEDDVVLAVEVDPAAVALLLVLTLELAAGSAVEYLVERLVVDIAQHDVEVLADGHVAVAVDYEGALDALAAEIEIAFAPLLVESHIVVVFLGVVDIVRDALGEMVGREKVAGGVEEIHGAVHADTHVDVVLLGHIDDELHILELVPRREAEHKRHGELVLEGFDDLDDVVVAVASTHTLVGFAIAVEGDEEVSRTVFAHHLDNAFRCEAVGEQRVVAVVFGEPIHDGVGFGVEDKFATFEAHDGAFGHTAAAHDALDIVEREVLGFLLPDGAMLAARLAERGGVNHQLVQLLMVRPKHVVEVEKTVVEIIVKSVHLL